MPAYGTPQAGSFSTVAFNEQGIAVYTATPGKNLRTISPGDKYTLYDAETVATGDESVAFARGPSPSGDDAGMTFSISWASAPTATISIQGSNVDDDAQYQDLYVSTNTQYDNYTDTVRWAFYRAHVTSYTAGGAVTVKVQR